MCPGLMPLASGAAVGEGGEGARFVNVLLNLLSLQHFPFPKVLPKVLLGLVMLGNYIVAEALSQPNPHCPV